MAKIMELAVNMSMLMSGNLITQSTVAAQKLGELQRKTQALQKVSGQVSQFQRQSSSLDTLRQRMTAAGERVQLLQRRMAQGGVNYQQYSKELEKARKEYSRLDEAYKKQKGSLDTLGEALARAGVNVKNLAGAQDKLQRELEQSERAQQRLTQAQNRYAQLRSKLDWGNIKGTVLGALGTYSVLKAPVELAADFEAAMARVKSVGFSKDDADIALFERMRAQAKQLGADTKYTAIEAAGAQENLIRSGMTPQMVMAAMPSVLNMAAAEGMSIESAGSIIAKGLGGMNLEGNMAPRLADILAYTSASSNTNIAMLGEAFKVAAPALASQSYSMEQVAAYLGILANKGFEGSEAGNALSSSMMRLAAAPKQTREALAELGVARRDKKGNGIPLPELMMKLYARLKNKSENEQLEYMSNIFGKNYGKQMIAFMQATASGQTKTMENGVFLESFGHASKMANINLDTLKGQMTILGSAWDGVRTTIGEMFTPIIRSGVEVITNVLSSVNTFMQKYPTFSKNIALVVGGGLTVTAGKGILDIVTSVLKLPGAWLEVHRAASAAGQVIGSVGSAVQVVGTSSSMLGSVWATIAGPLNVLLGLTVLLVANWKDVTEWAAKAGQAIANIDRTTPTSKLKPATQDYHIRQMESAFGLPPEIAHAEGGILTQPHIGLVAEAGPEAIIPLSKPQLGIPLLERAASILGMKVSTREKTKISSSHLDRVLSTQRDSLLSFSENIHAHSLGGIFGLTLPKQDAGMKRISSKPAALTSFIDAAKSFAGNSVQRVSEWVSSSLSSYASGAMSALSQYVNSEDSYSVRRAGDTFESRSADTTLVRNAPSVAVSSGPAPVINITVNGVGAEPRGLAEDIAAKVREALREISSMEERVSYA